MHSDMVLKQCIAPELATSNRKGKLTANVSSVARDATHTANPNNSHGTETPYLSRPSTRWALAKRDAHLLARPHALRPRHKPPRTDARTDHGARSEHAHDPPHEPQARTDANAQPGQTRPIGAIERAHRGPTKPTDRAPDHERCTGWQTRATPRAEGSKGYGTPKRNATYSRAQPRRDATT